MVNALTVTKKERPMPAPQLSARLLVAIRQKPGISRTELHDAVGMRVKGEDLDRALTLAAARGLATSIRVQTGGRPSERWLPTAGEAYRQRTRLKRNFNMKDKAMNNAHQYNQPNTQQYRHPSQQPVADPWATLHTSNHLTQPGTYVGTFIGVEDYALPSGEVRWKWRWHVAAQNMEADALTERRLSTKNKAGRLIAGLIGRDLQTGDKSKELVDACKGKMYKLTVGPGPQGGKASVQTVSQIEPF